MPPTQRPVASRILSKYEQERAYKLHRQKVSGIKHGIDNAPPKRYPHLVLRLKQIQKEEEKMADVDHQNKLLLQKMTQIMKTHGRVDNWNEEYEPRSLNYPHKQRQMEQIATENVAIARRLEGVQPIYKPDEWEEEYQHRKYLMELWASSSKDFDDSPRGRHRRRSQDYDDSKYNSDFESDDDAKSNKLPSIDGSEKKGDSKREKKSKDDHHATKLPKIKDKRKDKDGGMSEHKYQMYWGDQYDPDGENSKGRSEHGDQDDDDRKKTERRKENSKGKHGKDDDKNKDGRKDGHDKKGDKKGRGRSADGRNDDNNRDNNKNKNESSPVEADAKQLFKVAKEMASPDDILIKTLVKKSASHRQQVKKKFKEMYELDLDKELKNGLGPDWHLLIDEILTDPTDGDVRDLHAALKDHTIPTAVEILCSNQGNLTNIKDAYRKEFAVSLESDVSDKTKEPVQLLLLALLKEGRNESTDIDDKRVEKDATVLHEFGDGRWSDKNGKFMTLMEEKSMAHIKAVIKSYKSVSGGKEVIQSVKEDCDKEYAEAIIAFVSSAKGASDMYAERLYKNLDASNPVFVKTLVSRAEIDMPNITKAYKKKYDADLAEDIEDRCVHPTAKVLKELTTKTPSKKSKGGKKYAGVALAPPPKGKPVKRPDRSHHEDDSSNNPLNQSTKKGGDGSKQNKDGKKKDDKAPKTTGTIMPAKNFDATKDVERLHNAMDGFGTDEQIIIDVLINKNNEQRQVLKKKYKEKYKKDLMKELKSELRGDFEELVLALMMEPAEYDAHCLHEAVDGPGTKEAALIGILCTRSGKEIKAIKEQYRKAYTSDLENDVRSDTSGDFEEMLVDLLKGGRDPNWEVNQADAQQDAKELYKEDKSIKATDDTFKRVMTKKNRLQFKATSDEYKKLAKQELVESIGKSMSGDARDGYVGLAAALEDPIKFYADRLHEGFKGLGTNDTRLIRILVSRSEIDLADIKAKYAEIYGKSLREMVESETSGHYKRTLLSILGENDDKSKDETTKPKEDKSKNENKESGKPKAAKPKEKPKEGTGKPRIKSDKSKTGKNKKADESKTAGIGERRSPDGQSDEPADGKKGEKEEEKKEREWETMEPTGTIKEAKTLDPEEQCKILYEAMKGMGTDEEAIIKVLTSCSNTQRQNLKKTYKKKYKKDLTSELKGEVSGDLEEAILAMLMTPEEYTADRLHQAMSGIGTDERLLLYVIVTSSAKPQNLKNISKKYKEVHKKDLAKTVVSETSGVLQKVLSNILAGKRSQATQVKDKDVDEAAKKLHGEGESAFKYDVDYCVNMFTTLSVSQAKAVFSKYKELSGEEVTVSIEKHMAGYPEMALLAVARFLESPYLYTAHVLHEATDGAGTNDNLLMAIIVGRSETDLVNIKMAYKDTYRKSLEDVVQSECSGDYRKLLAAILNPQS